MNRLQFLSEIKKSLINTTKEVTLPFVNEEVEKIDEFRDHFIGLQWIKLEGITPASFQGVEERFINKTSILLYSDGEQIKAFEKVCLSCKSLVQWIGYDKRLKCFSCEKTYHIELETGELTCKHHHTKEKNNEWFIGM